MHDPVVVGGDRVKDPLVQDERGTDAGPYAGLQHGDAGLRLPVHGPDHRVGLEEGVPDARVVPSGAAAPLQERPVHPVGGEQVRGQVDASAVQVLAHVPEEVGQLEGDPECRRVRSGLLTGHHRPEYGQHLEADHRRGTVHVGAQVGVRRIVGDGQVAAHGRQEVGEQAVVDGVPRGGVGDGSDHGLPATAGAQSVDEVALQQPQQPVALLG